MKAIIIFILCILTVSCKAQTEIDEVSLKSREQADLVLEKMDSIKSSAKLLYSIEDKDFLLILKKDNKYTEYYISTENGKTKVIRELKIKKKNIELFKNAFNLNDYHSDFITKMPDAKFIRGKKTYFVIKNNEGKRYGEYSLSAFTLPLPIDGNLAGYLMRKLSEEISQSN